MTLATVFFLFVVYQLKHFLADYPLQTKYMLGKFKPGWDFLRPLAAHAGVHAWLTLVIASAYLTWSGAAHGYQLIRIAYGLGVLDFVVHFMMDRIKAGPKYMGRFKPLSAVDYEQAEAQANIWCMPDREYPLQRLQHNTYFWWCLGFDQMVHHLTHYAIIYILVTR